MSIKALVKVTNQLTFQVEGETEKELFTDIARVQEVFNHNKCGKCGNTNVKYVCRKDSDNNDWLEIVCQDFKCRAKLTYGVTKTEGQVFPRVRWNNLSETNQENRKDEKAYADEHKGWLPSGGWHIYKGEK